MKKLLAAAAIASIFASAAFAQSIPLPQVTTLTPGKDLVQVIPNGVPTNSNVYATVATLRGGSSANGIFASPLRLLDFKNNDGTTLAVSASSGKFGLTSTPGTSEWLVTEAANSNTKTDISQTEIILPASYVSASNVTVTCSTQYIVGAGTVGTHTLAAAAYLTAAAGTQGTTLIATAAQSVPAAVGNVAFTITGATLVPGSRLMLTFTLVIQDTGSSNITAQLNSCTLS